MTSFVSLLLLCSVALVAVAYPTNNYNDIDALKAELFEELLNKKTNKAEVMEYLESLFDEDRLAAHKQDSEDNISNLESAILEAVFEKLIAQGPDRDAHAEGLCPLLANPANGNIMYNTTEDVRITYTCNDGYKPVGPSTRTCEADSEGIYSWSDADLVFECLIDCGDLADPADGIVEYDDTVEGSVATYTCDGEYYLSGDAERLCESDGKWSGAEPICVEIPHCDSLCDPQNGRVTYTNSTYVGSMGTYSCNGGYYRSGSRTQTCREDREWSDSPPRCLKCKGLLTKCGGTNECCGNLTCKKITVFSSEPTRCHL